MELRRLGGRALTVSRARRQVARHGLASLEAGMQQSHPSRTLIQAASSVPRK